MIRAVLFLLTASARAQVAPLPEAGFTPLFDGKTLANWDCDPGFWRVEDGALTGETTAEHQPPQNIFCIYKDGDPADFELRLQYRLTGAPTGNSGIQYRSEELPNVAKWVLKGYQADIDAQQRYTGQLYEERGRAFVALRGQMVEVFSGQKPGFVAQLGAAADLKAAIKLNDWNDVIIIARGNTLVHIINGAVMCVVIDEDAANRKMSGKLGIQLHKTTGPMKIETRNIRLKTF